METAKGKMAFLLCQPVFPPPLSQIARVGQMTFIDPDIFALTIARAADMPVRGIVFLKRPPARGCEVKQRFVHGVRRLTAGPPSNCALHLRKPLQDANDPNKTPYIIEFSAMQEVSLPNRLWLQTTNDSPNTSCEAVLYDHVTKTDSYKIQHVYVEGSDRLYRSPRAADDLPSYVQSLLQPLPAELQGKCADAGRVPVVMVPGLFHMNVYHMLLYFVRHIVQGVLQAWGPQAFQKLGFVLISHPHQGSMPGNLVHFRIAEVFLPGGDVVDQMRASGQACLHFEEVLLMQEGPFWSGPVDTQGDGFEESLERRSYNQIRKLYRQVLAPQISPAAGKADAVKVLYLGRAQTDARHIINEAGLLESLELEIAKIQGVEMQVAIDFDSIPFEEQVRQSASADILIGPHGAGLTHVMFMRPHSVLVELLPHAWADPGYRTLSQYLGLVYMHWQQTEEALTEEVLVVGNATRHTGRSNSFHVDTEAVVSLVRSAINIAYMVGERYWPPCPGYEIIAYERGVPIDCPELWVRDEGVKRLTPPSSMPDTPDVQQQGKKDAAADADSKFW